MSELRCSEPRMILPYRQRLPRIAWLLAVVFIIVAASAFVFHGWAHLRAIALLLRIKNPSNPGVFAEVAADAFDEKSTEVPTSSGPIHARLYVPKDRPHAPGMVIVHGVHHLGMDEPRLVAFARAMSASGIRVLTPELASLADYRVERTSVDLIGYSAKSLSASVGGKVGVLGLSFAGGLALIAAADPQFEPYISFVASVGTHDDLERVSQFLVSNRIPRPDGTTRDRKRLDHAVGLWIQTLDSIPLHRKDAEGT